MSRSWLDRLGLHRPELRAWALYDVANSAWMTTVMTAVFPPFFVALAVAAGVADPEARSKFAFASSISVILVGLSGPLLGAIADLRGSKKAFLAVFIAIGVACCFGLYFSTSERWALALGVFVLGNVAVDGRVRARLPRRRSAARRQPRDGLRPQALRHRRGHRGAAVVRERGRVVGALLAADAAARARAAGAARGG
jgi:MFS family permease